MAKALADMQVEVFTNNVEKGWYDDTRTFGDEIALLHSEASEALDYYRKIGLTSRTDPVQHHRACQLQEYKDGSCTCGVVGKPTDVASEFADVFIRLLDIAHRYSVDLEFEYERKMAYNRTRPYKHGGRAI